MIDPYIAVALQTTVRHCAKRSEVFDDSVQGLIARGSFTRKSL